MARTSKLDLGSNLAKGGVLTLVGLILLAIGAVLPQPTGGGIEAVAAGFAILGGFIAILLGIILYFVATRI